MKYIAVNWGELGRQATMETPLTRTEYRIRDYFLFGLGLTSFEHVNLAEVARGLKLSRQQVSTLVNRLVEIGIIEKERKGGVNFYKVSDEIVRVG